MVVSISQLDKVGELEHGSGSSESFSVHSLDCSLKKLNLLSHPLSVESETEIDEDCFFFEGEEDGDDGLRSSCRENLSLNSSCHSFGQDQNSQDLTNGWFSDGPSPFQVSRRTTYRDLDPSSELFRREAKSRAVDIPVFQRERSKGLKPLVRSGQNLCSVRETLLEEAWERKRDHMLYENFIKSAKKKMKAEQLERCVSDCGKVQDLGTEAVKKSRTRSLTDDDFDELRGCIDLGFRFDENCIPELRETLPALEVYYAVQQSLHDSPSCVSPVSQTGQSGGCSSSSSPLTPTWKVASPGDDPKDVKGRLRHWAQAVACSARLCY